MEPLLVVALLVGFIGVMGITVFLTPRLTARPTFGRASQGRPMPFRRHTLLLSKAERSLYRALRSFVPDHMIFAKVKVADLVVVSPKQPFWEHFNLINRTYVDFVVCDATLSPVLAIELDHSHSPTNPSAINDVEKVLATASLPVIHIPHKRQYLFNELRRLLRPYLTLPHPLV